MKRKSVSIIMVSLLLLAVFSSSVTAKPLLSATSPSLGAAGSFSVLGFSEVTNTGTTKVSGDIGVWSGTLISGLGDIVVGGAVHQTDGVAQQAQADASAAVGSLTGQAATNPILGALDSQTLVPGVYDIGAGSLGGGVLTLDGAGTYIFRASSSLTSAGSISLINGARACDVFWYVPTQANLVSGSFVGTIIAGTGVVFGANVSLDGRALAIGGNVTLISNNITGPTCASAPVSTETTTTPTVATGTPVATPTTTTVTTEVATTPVVTTEPSVVTGTPVATLGIPNAPESPKITPVTGKGNIFVDFVEYIKYFVGSLFHPQ